MAENTSEPAASALISKLTVAEDATGPGPGPAATALPSVPALAPGTAAAPPLHLFNSMTKKKELFVPLVEGKVGMYVCGVTPYDFSHVGHARAYVAFDVLYRYRCPAPIRCPIAA